MKTITITIPAEFNKKRVDQFLSTLPEIPTRSFGQKLIAGGHITSSLNPDQPIKKTNYRLKMDEVLTIQIPEPTPLDIEPQEMDLDIIFEDQDLIVLNKPQQISVHPGAGEAKGTLVNGLLYHCQDLSGIGGVERPGIVHRIDKDTSGLLVICKNDKSHQHLAKQFEAHTTHRRYTALVLGNPNPPKRSIKSYIARHPVHRKKFHVDEKENPKGKWAITHFETLETFEKCSLLRIQLETGRTHQIRVHLTHLGHPLIGDPLYGSFRQLNQRSKLLYQIHKKQIGQMLHASELGFNHPSTGEDLLFKADLPPFFKESLNLLRDNYK